jgi:ATP-dependent helicase YprA (DUF1998 family)
MLEGTKTLLEKCACEHGCPACVGPVTAPGRKALALSLLAALE